MICIVEIDSKEKELHKKYLIRSPSPSVYSNYSFAYVFNIYISNHTIIYTSLISHTPQSKRWIIITVVFAATALVMPVLPTRVLFIIVEVPEKEEEKEGRTGT